MRRSLLTVPAAVVIAVAVFALANPAAAETRPPGGAAYVDDSGSPTAEATDGQHVSTDRGGSPEANTCVWKVAIEDDFYFELYSDTGTAQHSATGRWLEKVCEGLGIVEVNGSNLIPEGGLVDLAALAQSALSSVAISGPGVRTSPDVGNRLVVRVPTWLWLDAAWWHDYTATASAGRVTTTVTARPVSATWSLGDGGSITCSGRGVAWHAGLPEDATNCSHTYTTSSAGQPGGTFGLAATVRLEVTWTSNIGAGGTLPAITRTSSRAVEVGEIQAVGTGS
jgi:hypothetical protein